MIDTVDNFEITNQIVNDFNRKSNTAYISARYLANTDYDSDLQDVILSSGSPDIAYISRASLVNAYAEKDKLLNLADYLTKSELKIANYGAAFDIVSTDNATYALPNVRSTWVIFYNKTIFDQLGVPYPKALTWDEYAALTRKLTTGEGYKKIWGGMIMPWTLNLGAIQKDEYLTDDDLANTKEYLQILNSFYNIDKTHPTLSQIETYYTSPYQMFLDGRIATMINGDWSIPLLRSMMSSQKIFVDFDIAPLPVHTNTDNTFSIGACSYLVGLSKSTHQAEVFEFLEYYCGEPGAKVKAASSVCPAYFTTEIEDLYVENTKLSGTENFYSSLILNDEGTHAKYAQISEIFTNKAVVELKGKITIDEAIEGFTNERDFVLP